MAQVTYKFITQRAKDKGETLEGEKTHMVTAEMITSGANDYGNKHYLVIYEESGYEYSLDARYDVRFNTNEKFYKNILDVLKDQYDMAEYKLTDRR